MNVIGFRPTVEDLKRIERLQDYFKQMGLDLNTSDVLRYALSRVYEEVEEPLEECEKSGCPC
jgi:hypothetical protein